MTDQIQRIFTERLRRPMCQHTIRSNTVLSITLCRMKCARQTTNDASFAGLHCLSTLTIFLIKRNIVLKSEY